MSHVKMPKRWVLSFRRYCSNQFLFQKYNADSSCTKVVIDFLVTPAVGSNYMHNITENVIHGTSFYAVKTDFEMSCTHAVTECKQIVASTPVSVLDNEPKPPKDDSNFSNSKYTTFKKIPP